ncbi:MAG: class I SAM-dependent methyltransferase [Deltaproteobacteria bacterium]
MPKERFDAGYFDRFYESRKTRVHGKARVARLARGVTEMIAWFGGDLGAVLDIGAGPGLWRDWFATNKKSVRYVSTDASAYACERYGHTRRDIARWRGRERYDLIVCQGVLPYLSDDDATRAIDHIGAMSRGFLYLEAVTARDLRDVCDREATDVTVHARTGAWYRERLDKHFVRLGCGLFYRATGPLTFYELERSDSPRRRPRFTSG